MFSTSLQLLSAAAVPCADALQYVDTILTLLHSFIKREVAHSHPHIHTHANTN